MLVLRDRAMTPEKLGLIGRDYVLIKKLAEQVRTLMRREYDFTALHETADRRGQWFEVRLPTGHIARITVTLDRIEQAP